MHAVTDTINVTVTLRTDKPCLTLPLSSISDLSNNDFAVIVMTTTKAVTIAFKKKGFTNSSTT